MDQQNKFSVIIPVHNSETTLFKCVKSIIMQEYSNYEIILVENGSTDLSCDVCEKLYIEHSDYIKYIKFEGAGVSHARNQGLKMATGDIIFFVDSDDYIDDGCFEYINNLFNKNPQIDLVLTGYYYDDNAKRSPVYFSKNNYNFNKLISKVILNGRFCGALWNKFFRKDLLEKRYFDNDLEQGEDLHFIINVLANNRNNKAYISNNAFYHYSTSTGSTNQYNALFDENNILKSFKALSKIEGTRLLNNKESEILHAFRAALSIDTLYRFGKELNELRINNLKDEITENFIFYVKHFNINILGFFQKISQLIVIKKFIH